MALYGWVGIIIIVGCAYVFIRDLVNSSLSLKTTILVSIGALLGLFVVYSSSPSLQAFVRNFLTQ